MNQLQRCLLVVALSTAPAAAVAGPDGGWEWEIGPYGWATSVSTDLNAAFPGIGPDGGPIIPPSGSISNTTRFLDVIDKLDGAFMGHVEGRGDHFGVFADVLYVGLAQARDRQRLRIDSDLDLRLFEGAFLWRMHRGSSTGLELFAGTRIIDVDFTSRFLPNNPVFAQRAIDASDTLYDFMLGARYSFELSPRWSLTFRGDGSWGDSEGTWNAGANARLSMRNGAWYFGYRYLNIDVEPRGQSLSVDLHGPFVGYGFTF